MVNITKAIMHILDATACTKICSDVELDLSDEKTCEFLTRHVERAYKDPGLKFGEFRENSDFMVKLCNYLEGSDSFLNLSHFTANLLYQAISDSDKVDSSDVVVCEFQDGDKTILAILKLAHKKSFTHQVSNDSGQVNVELINHYAILPNLSQKLDEYAFIDTKTLKIRFVDKLREMDGKEAYTFSDGILKCTSSPSPKETLKMVNEITQTVAENYGSNVATAVSKLKNCIVESGEMSDFIDPLELGKEIFGSSKAMQDAYVEQLKEANVPEKVEVSESLLVNTGKNHKIKTDTGIEISFPVDYFKNKDFMEFINNPDGTISIQLKNIGKITNK